MTRKSLSVKQQRFVDEYLIDLNATHAARRAGYAESAARSKGSLFLSKPHIAAVIAKKLAERSENTGLSAEWLLARLGEEVKANLADLFEPSGLLKPAKDWPEIWQTGLVTGVDVEETIRDGVVTIRLTKVRLSDRMRRLELIGKHVNVGAFEKRVKVNPLDGLAERLERAGISSVD